MEGTQLKRVVFCFLNSRFDRLEFPDQDVKHMIDLQSIEQEILELSKKLEALKQLKKVYSSHENTVVIENARLFSTDVNEFDLDTMKKVVRDLFVENGNKPTQKSGISEAVKKSFPNTSIDKIQEKLTYLVMPKTKFLEKVGYGKYRLL